MIYFTVFVLIYLSIGFGFALSAWLDAREKRVKKKLPITLNISNWVVFIMLWWVIAVYCYRAEVKRTIPTIDYFMN